MGEAQGEDRPRVRVHFEVAGDGALATSRLARLIRAQRERIAPCARYWHAGAPPDPGSGAAVAEAGLDPPGHAHIPREAFDPTLQLTHRLQTGAPKRHGVGDSHGSTRGGEGRLQDIRPWQVAPLTRGRFFRLERKTAASLEVQNSGEHGRRIQVR